MAEAVAVFGAAEQAALPRMTYEQFLEWLDEDTKAEWVDGEVVQMSPASLEHVSVVGFIEAVVREAAEQADGGVVCADTYLMRLGSAHTGRCPDVLYVAAEHVDRLGAHQLEGPADLVVEVISPESRARDRGEKYYEYEQAGVPEYWLIDPQRKQAEFYQLDAGGVYRSVLPEEGVYRSRVLPGLRLRVDWLWQRPLPKLRDVRRELGAA